MTLNMWPGGPDFPPLTGPIIADDEHMAERFRLDPGVAAVEFAAQWRTSQSAFLAPELVERFFAPWQGETLSTQQRGRNAFRYLLHCDLSHVGANTGIAVGHLEPFEGDDHVVFDYLRAFKPSDSPDGEIVYEEIEDAITDLSVKFGLSGVTFDQYASPPVIQRLRRRLGAIRGCEHITIQEYPATRMRNIRDAESFKMSLTRSTVHGPPHDLAREELLFLQVRGNGTVDHPTSGPVQTSDLADCLFAVHAQLRDGSNEYADRLGINPYAFDMSNSTPAARRRTTGYGIPRSTRRSPRPTSRGGRFDTR